MVPYLCLMRYRDRITEFKQRCQSYTQSANPERCTQEIPGHQSAAVHRAYAQNAAATIPSLDKWEELVGNKIIDIHQIPKVAQTLDSEFKSYFA